MCVFVSIPELAGGSAELTTICDDNLLGWLPTPGAQGLDLLHNLHALLDTPEHHMFAVQPVSLDGADEELGAIGVGARIGHGQDPWAIMLQLEVLIREATPVDGFAACAVVVGEVPSL